MEKHNAELKLMNRKGQVGVRELPGLMIALGALLVIGLFVFSTIAGSTVSSFLSGGVQFNTTTYCAAGTVLNPGVNCTTALPINIPDLNSFNGLLNTRTNVAEGFDLSSILIIVLAAAAIIGILTAAFI